MNSQIARGRGVPDILTEEGSGVTARPPARAFLLVAQEMGRGSLQAGAEGGEKDVGRRGGPGMAGAASPGWQMWSFPLAGLPAGASSGRHDWLGADLLRAHGASPRSLSRPWVQAKSCCASVKYRRLFHWPPRR